MRCENYLNGYFRVIKLRNSANIVINQFIVVKAWATCPGKKLF